MENTELSAVETQSDVTEESSSSEFTESNSGGAQAGAPSQQASEIDWSKAFEHPRFKELVEQKNQYQTESKSLRDTVSELQRQLKDLSQPKTQSQAEKDELIEDIRKVDPRFAERLERLNKGYSSIEQLQAKLQDLETKQSESVRERTVQEARSKINQLHESNKVSPELKSFINNEMDRLAITGQLKELSQVDATYKAVHEQFSKFVDGIKRAERESYVQAKKPDSKIPVSQPKGEPAKAAPKKTAYPKDREAALAQIANDFVKSQARMREASSV
jgi:DNA repair exonuclease SbcCD ATPase subunit